MNGWDFSILWSAGQAVLHGLDPYQVPYFYYPLPFSYLLAGFAIFPLTVAFWLWIAVNLGILLYFFRLNCWKWLLFVPVLHLLSSGQVDLFFWALERGIRPGWQGVFLAALITLKPQAALLLLPWHLVDWLRHDRKILFRWAFITSLLWLVPLIWRPDWIRDWLQSTPPYSFLSSASNTPGIFSLLRLFPDLWPLLAGAALVIFAWGLSRSEATARACALLASPVGLFYSSMALLDQAPALLLVPVSLAAAGFSLLWQNFIPFILLPVAVIGWQLWEKKAYVPALG